MEQQIVSLATQCQMPVPVERQGKEVLKDSLNKENCVNAQTLVKQPKKKREEPTVPYQALPVTADTVITHNITPALPVIEDIELSTEVRRTSSFGCAPGSLFETSNTTNHKNACSNQSSPLASFAGARTESHSGT